MFEEWKNFILFKELVEDEEVNIVPHIIILIFLVIVYLIWK